MQWFYFNLSDFSVSFLSILFEGVPFMFIGTLIAGLVDAFVPNEVMERLVRRQMALGVVASGLLGLVFPMCECGVVPVIRRMVLKGMPVSCGLTYLLAAPIVNPIVAISTYAAFRGQHPFLVTGLRLGLGFVVACVVGLLVELLPAHRVLNKEMLRLRPSRVTRREPEAALAVAGGAAVEHHHHGHEEHDHAHDHAHVHDHDEEDDSHHHHHHYKPGFGTKLLAAFRCAGFDFLDVGLYLIIGAALTSVFNTAVNQQAILPLASHLVPATGAMMLLAMVLSLCSTSDAFIAANFVAFPLGAKLAFMVLGPMMDLKLLFMYGLVFRRRFTLGLAAALFIGIGAVCALLGGFIR